MEKVEIRAVIKFFVISGKLATEIHKIIRDVLGESAPSFTTVSKWTSEFKRGRQSIEDDPRSGRPSTSVNFEMVDKVHDMVLTDRRVKVREIAEALKISSGSVYTMLSDVLGMSKLSSRWVPRMLTPDQKRNRVQTSKECLALLQRNKQDFWRRLVTTDETWLHYYEPERKEQSKQWTQKGENTPRKFKRTISAGKVMASVFWDANGILLVDYLEKGRTINSEYYCALLDKLRAAIDEKRPSTKRKKILFLQDNAPCHASHLTTSKILSLHFELLPHPPYSPDLAPSDYFLFPNLKKHLSGKKYETNDELIAETEAYFEELDKSCYSEGIMALEKRWSKCIEVRGDYVEK